MRHRLKIVGRVKTKKVYRDNKLEEVSGSKNKFSFTFSIKLFFLLSKAS